MRALVLEAGRLSYREDLPAPQPKPGESRLEVLVAGVCATDLALARGYLDFAGIPGHEFVARGLDGPFAGRRVVGEINAGCGRCARCRAGLARHCDARTVLGISGRSGCFAEQIALPHENLHPVPDGVATRAAVFAEPLAAAFEILEQVWVRPGMRALVIGDGRLGLLSAHVLRRAGADLHILGHHGERSARLLGGVPCYGTPAEAKRRPPFDLAIEASGAPEALADAIELTRPRGTIVLKTTSERSAALDLAPLVIGERTLVGSRCGPFAPALAELSCGALEPQGMIDACYPLAEGVRAFAHAAAPGTLKVLVEVAAPREKRGAAPPGAPPGAAR